MWEILSRLRRLNDVVSVSRNKLVVLAVQVNPELNIQASSFFFFCSWFFFFHISQGSSRMDGIICLLMPYYTQKEIGSRTD